MKTLHSYAAFLRVLTLGALLAVGIDAQAQTDPLPSWNDGAAKQAIVAFVKDTTTQGSPKFVPPAERIATFDQDGTLWVEHPMYSFAMYALESVPALIKAKPELAKVPPFSTVLEILKGDRAAVAKLTMPDVEKILAATYTNRSVDQFNAEVTKWIAEAKDPIRMARAMKHAVIAGREAYLAGRMPKRLYADPSSPLAGLI